MKVKIGANSERHIEDVKVKVKGANSERHIEDASNDRCTRPWHRDARLRCGSCRSPPL